MSYFIYFPSTDGAPPTLYPNHAQENISFPSITHTFPQFPYYPTDNFLNSQYSIPNYQTIYPQPESYGPNTQNHHPEALQPELSK